MQTETAIDNVKRKPDSYTQDNSTQVVLSDLPGYESELLPIVEQLVNGTLEQAFTEMLEEEEIKAIRQQRIQFQQMKLAEMTTSRLMNTLNEWAVLRKLKQLTSKFALLCTKHRQRK